MIDEKKLIKQLKKWLHNIYKNTDAGQYENGAGECIACVIEEINKQPKVREWIPISERLPENDGLYQVCFEDEFITTVEYKTDENGNQDFELWADSGEVIAWMPLPETFKESDLD